MDNINDDNIKMTSDTGLLRSKGDSKDIATPWETKTSDDRQHKRTLIEAGGTAEKSDAGLRKLMNRGDKIATGEHNSLGEQDLHNKSECNPRHNGNPKELSDKENMMRASTIITPSSWDTMEDMNIQRNPIDQIKFETTAKNTKF